jgi:thiamine thiazole synthase
MSFSEVDISQAIIRGYHEKLLDRLTSDVIIVGAGPSGLIAAMDLGDRGHKVTVIEKRLTPGGGVWGGAMAMNAVVVQDQAVPLLDRLGVSPEGIGKGLFRTDAIELAAALALHAVQSGAVVLNMMVAEDLCVRDDHVGGVVVNRAGGTAPLPIDPLTLHATAVADATGHDAALVAMLQRRALIEPQTVGGEGPMDAVAGERFVVEHTGEIYPGLWVSGMAVCAAYGGPRMGPIFGGMLLSGRRSAEQITQAFGRSVRPRTHSPVTQRHSDDKRTPD